MIVCLSLAYTGITFQQPAVFAACADIGGMQNGGGDGDDEYGGTGGVCVVVAGFGYFVKVTGSYEAPLVPMAVLAGAGMLLWGKVDLAGVGEREGVMSGWEAERD